MELNASPATDLAISAAQPAGFQGAQLTVYFSSQPAMATVPYPSCQRALPTINCRPKWCVVTVLAAAGVAFETVSSPETSSSVVRASVGCQPAAVIWAQAGSVWIRRSLTDWRACACPNDCHWAADRMGVG